MSARRSPIQYERSYCSAEQPLAGSALREVEALLARLVAQAYLGDHPELLRAEELEQEPDETAGTHSLDPALELAEAGLASP